MGNIMAHKLSAQRGRRMTTKSTTKQDPEITAISAVHEALKDLDPGAQTRVLNYVAAKLNIVAPRGVNQPQNEAQSDESSGTPPNERTENRDGAESDELEGISPVAKKWMARNGLQTERLSAVFSLGVDEIDLIAQTVPGKSKRERTRSVFLLKGVAAYLGTGAARFTHQQVKEACLHYDAYDAANFATRVKSLASEVSGTKETGYVLTARGLANATEMIKAMVQ